jgi:hypothetical protein
MMVVFYRTLPSGSTRDGRIVLDAGRLAVEGAEHEAEVLFEGVDRADLAAVEAAMRDAPRRFDGAYLRAEFVEG